MLTMSEVGLQLGVTRQAVHLWVQRGLLVPAVRRPGSVSRGPNAVAKGNPVSAVRQGVRRLDFGGSILHAGTGVFRSFRPGIRSQAGGVSAAFPGGARFPEAPPLTQ